MGSQIPLDGRFIVVAGGGHFGAKAVKFAKESNARVAIVDIDPYCAAANFANKTLSILDHEDLCFIRRGSAVLFLQDAVDFLHNLFRLITPDYIVPGIPGHLAGRVAEKWITSQGLSFVSPSKIVRRIGESMPKDTVIHVDKRMGVIVTSYMPRGRMCRVPCQQPKERCPTTGRQKIGPMHQLLDAAIRNNVTLPCILVSRPVGGEVGCFQGADLTFMLSKAKELKAPYTLAVGTSCDCHGILNVFAVS